MGEDAEALGHFGYGIAAVEDMPDGFLFKLGGKTRGTDGPLP